MSGFNPDQWAERQELGAPRAIGLDDDGDDAVLNEIRAEIGRMRANGCRCALVVTIVDGPTVEGVPSTMVDYRHDREFCPYNARHRRQ